MNRRDVLRKTVALAGVGTLAGCLNEGSGDDGGDGGDGGGGGSDGGDGGDTTEAPTPSIDDRSIATQAANCMSGDSGAAAEVSSDSMVVTVAGTIETPDPCHAATIADASYDGDADSLALTVGYESDGEMCSDCVGAVEYEATVTFTGRLPARATVDHEGTDGTTTITETDL